MAKKRIEEAPELLNITITLSPITVTVERGATDKDTLLAAQKALIEQLNTKFPYYTYGVSSADSLTFENVKIGMIVEEADPKDKKPRYGIVTGINKKTINVCYKNRILVQGPPQLYKLSKKTFEEVASFYKQMVANKTTPDGDFIESTSFDMFLEGDAGYLKTPDGLIPCVIASTKGDNYKVYPVGEYINGRYWNLKEAQLKYGFKGTK